MKYTSIKFYLLNLFVVLLAATNCLCQIISKDSSEHYINQVNKEYTNINNDTAKFKITEKDIFGLSAEGGELSKFFDGKNLRKAILTLYGETGQSTREYYFLNGEIIFVHQRSEKYKAPIYTGKPEIESQEENKFYFKNQRLIRWIDNDGKTVDRELYFEKEDEILESLKIIK